MSSRNDWQSIYAQCENWIRHHYPEKEPSEVVELATFALCVCRGIAAGYGLAGRSEKEVQLSDSKVIALLCQLQILEPPDGVFLAPEGTIKDAGHA